MRTAGRTPQDDDQLAWARRSGEGEPEEPALELLRQLDAVQGPVAPARADIGVGERTEDGVG